MSRPLQTDLFQSDQALRAQMPDVRYVEGMVARPQPWFASLQSSLAWNPRYQSRLTASFGVTCGGQDGQRVNRRLPEFLQPLTDLVTRHFGFEPNNCLANYYPDGDHYIGFHSDQDTEQSRRTGVAILSLGSVREMVLRRIDHHRERYYYPLQPGSGFYMDDLLQKTWQHGMPRQPGRGPRISLSFRKIVPD